MKKRYTRVQGMYSLAQVPASMSPLFHCGRTQPKMLCCAQGNVQRRLILSSPSSSGPFQRSARSPTLPLTKPVKILCRICMAPCLVALSPLIYISSAALFSLATFHPLARPRTVTALGPGVPPPYPLCVYVYLRFLVPHVLVKVVHPGFHSCTRPVSSSHRLPYISVLSVLFASHACCMLLFASCTYIPIQQRTRTTSNIQYPIFIIHIRASL